MANDPSQFCHTDPAAVAEQAAAWVARRDRGLTPTEQDEFLQWLAADARHAEALAVHTSAFERMMQLYEWQPGRSAEPNPDLFAPRLRRRSRRAWRSLGLAAAALVVLGAVWWSEGRRQAAPPAAVKSYVLVNERQALPDGSIVELKDGSRLTVNFSAALRRVALVGEAHFQVAPNPARPFVVEAGGVAVRAVGTAFSVRLGDDAVEVLVTEGRVSVEHAAAPSGTVPSEVRELAPPPLVQAGERAVVKLESVLPPQVTPLTATEIAEALEWRAPRLQFFETPLAVAIAEFNRQNGTQLVLGDASLGAVPIGGTFRADNIDGFVRLLELTLDLRAEHHADWIVITRGPADRERPAP